ncbi:MAG: hypothetical protein IV107_11715 [Paucibacter sp.]|nr:hypothetical protein [Roseateles sp.]
MSISEPNNFRRVDQIGALCNAPKIQNKIRTHVLLTMTNADARWARESVGLVLQPWLQPWLLVGRSRSLCTGLLNGQAEVGLEPPLEMSTKDWKTGHMALKAGTVDQHVPSRPSDFMGERHRPQGGQSSGDTAEGNKWFRKKRCIPAFLFVVVTTK